MIKARPGQSAGYQTPPVSGGAKPSSKAKPPVGDTPAYGFPATHEELNDPYQGGMPGYPPNGMDSREGYAAQPATPVGQPVPQEQPKRGLLRRILGKDRPEKLSIFDN